MLPFAVSIVPGESPYRQVVYAATKAVVSGELAPGSTFPSVRELSQALKINPNTAHKVVAELVRNGVIEVLPGIGTVVARAREATVPEKHAMLARELEVLLVESGRLGITRAELLAALDEHWIALYGSDVMETDVETDVELHGGCTDD